jgi:hypothetical protein
MRKIFILSISLAVLAYTAPAMAVPALQPGEVVFEFNSWEYVVPRDREIGEPEFDPTNPLSLLVGDMFEGVFDLDSITDGVDSYYDPQLAGTEITGFFTGMVLNSVTPLDADDDGFPDLIYATFTFSDDARIEVWFDEDNDLDLTSRANAVASAIDGTELLLLDWGEFRTTAQTQDTFSTDDDTTSGFGHVDVNHSDPLTWLWTDRFESDIFEYPALSGIFYDMEFTDVIYAPFSVTYMDNAVYAFDPDWEPGDPLVWDFYNTDDLRGVVVPEPATMALFAASGLALLRRRRR